MTILDDKRRRNKEIKKEKRAREGERESASDVGWMEMASRVKVYIYIRLIVKMWAINLN